MHEKSRWIWENGRPRSCEVSWISAEASETLMGFKWIGISGKTWMKQFKIIGAFQWKKRNLDEDCVVLRAFQVALWVAVSLNTAAISRSLPGGNQALMLRRLLPHFETWMHGYGPAWLNLSPMFHACGDAILHLWIFWFLCSHAPSCLGPGACWDAPTVEKGGQARKDGKSCAAPNETCHDISRTGRNQGFFSPELICNL